MNQGLFSHHLQLLESVQPSQSFILVAQIGLFIVEYI